LRSSRRSPISFSFELPYVTETGLYIFTTPPSTKSSTPAM
jgi:hypothetical protein